MVRPRDLFGIVETLAGKGHRTKRVCRLLAIAPSGWSNRMTFPVPASHTSRPASAEVGCPYASPGQRLLLWPPQQTLELMYQRTVTHPRGNSWYADNSEGGGSLRRTGSG